MGYCIIDISKTSDRQWPENMPDTIKLVTGCHFKDWDISYIHRKEDWYKELIKTVQDARPWKDPRMPIGVDDFEIEMNGAVIVKMER